MTNSAENHVASQASEEAVSSSNRMSNSLLGKVSLAVFVTAGLSFAIVLFATLNSSRTTLLAQFTDDAIAITDLLAAGATGGVRWKKSDVVAKTYEATVNAENSNVRGRPGHKPVWRSGLGSTKRTCWVRLD